MEEGECEGREMRGRREGEGREKGGRREGEGQEKGEKGRRGTHFYSGSIYLIPLGVEVKDNQEEYTFSLSLSSLQTGRTYFIVQSVKGDWKTYSREVIKFTNNFASFFVKFKIVKKNYFHQKEESLQPKRLSLSSAFLFFFFNCIHVARFSKMEK
jgi:hypothetical protein